MRNSSQGNFDLLADYIYVKIVIILIIDMDFLGRQYDIVVQSTGCSQSSAFIREISALVIIFYQNMKV